MKTPDPRGYPKSSGLANAHVGGRLTDARIAHYARLGFYGSEEQRRQLEADSAKPETIRLVNPLAEAMRFLSSL